jgi:hypothetical protein
MIEWLVSSADLNAYYTPYLKSKWSTLLVMLCLGVASFFLCCDRFCSGKRIRRRQFSLLKPRESAVFFRSSEAP